VNRLTLQNHRIYRHFWRCLMAALSSLICCMALAKTPTVLSDGQGRFEMWPNVQVFKDLQGQSSLQQMMAAPERFVVPTTAYATLGLSKHPFWLKVPFSVSPSSDGLWVLDIDYSPLNRVEVYLMQGQDTVQSAVFSNLSSVTERTVNSRTPTLVLRTKPGATYELYVRVQNTGAMILPITISKPVDFHMKTLNEQMLQGVLLGVALCFLAFSLVRGIAFRELFFLKYALLILGGVLFSLLQTGIGSQYLWFANPWIETHMGGLSAFLASTGSFLFIEQALGNDMKPWLRRWMKIGAGLCVFLALCYALDWIGIELVTLLVSTLGLVPALLGLPGAIAMARRGERVGWYFLVAWIVYFVTTAILVEVIKGRVDVGFWTMHSFQFGATFDMFIFMAVLALRNKAIQAEIRKTKRERDTFLSLANTDPLTGLPNRRSLQTSIEDAIAQSNPANLVAVYMLDLDNFKLVNDQLGHDVGDELLIGVATRLKNTLRSTDVVSRLGGDEFVVLSKNLSTAEQAHELGEKLKQAFNEPFLLANKKRAVGLTVGYAIAPLDGQEAGEMLRLADAAMYVGKQAGKHCLRRVTAHDIQEQKQAQTFA
jgi:diguanylate cyclase